MDKRIIDYTLDEFKAMEPYKPTVPFTNVIIVPMDDIHDSGFRCMKFVLLDKNVEICGVVYTGSDVVWPNGIGNYGKDLGIYNGLPSMVPKIGLHFDCLPESGCIRIMMDCECELPDFIGSDFIFYKKEA